MIRDIHPTSTDWLEGNSGSDRWDRTPGGPWPREPMEWPWHASEWLLGAMLVAVIVSATCVLAWLGREIITQAGIHDVLSAITR